MELCFPTKIARRTGAAGPRLNSSKSRENRNNLAYSWRADGSPVYSRKSGAGLRGKFEQHRSSRRLDALGPSQTGVCAGDARASAGRVFVTLLAPAGRKDG